MKARLFPSQFSLDWAPCLAFLALAANACLAIHGLHQQSVTVDEFAHLPAGLSYWQTGSFFAYRVNPPLVKLLAALPVLVERPRLALTQQTPDEMGDERTSLGRRFLEANRNNYFNFFIAGRYSVVVLSLLGGWCVFYWTRELFGSPSGVVAVFLWSFCPNILAHGQLITTDMGAATSTFNASYFYWRWLRRPTWKSAVLAGVLLGIAELTKFTCLVLYPVWAFLWLVSLFARRRSPALMTGASAESLCLASNKHQFIQLMTMVFLSLLVINAGYGFEGTFKHLGDLNFQSQDLQSSQACSTALTPRLRIPVPP